MPGERADLAPGAALPPPGHEAVMAQPVMAHMVRARDRWRRLDQRHPWLLDSLLSLFVFGISVANFQFGDGRAPFGASSDARGDLPVAVPYAFAAAFAIALWWRRRSPAATFVAIAAVGLAQWAVDLWQPAGLSILIALYTLAAIGSLRVLPWAVVISAVEAAAIVTALADPSQYWWGLFFILGTVTAAVALGLTIRIRRLYTAALEEHARQMEVERDQRERLIASAERSRIAREMHDILGHNLSVMVTLADGAATLAGKRGEQSARTLRMLGDTGREAMSELRRVLGVLRADGRDPRSLSPQPGVGDLDTLLERVRAAGLTVTCQTSGHLDRLGPSVQLTVYRIIQEALTNTLKHADIPAAAAAVTLTASAGQVHIRVVDTGTGATGPDPGEDREPGHGVIGIRQRAALYGGTATIGPREGGIGWIVDVVLQRTAPSPDTGEHP